jgi:hypothetical protein
MANFPKASDKVVLRGPGVAATDTTIGALRDAAGYSKQMPQPPRKVTLPGIVGPTSITGLPATDGLAGANVSGGGLPDGAAAGDVMRPAVAATNFAPAVPGEIALVLPPPALPAVPPTSFEDQDVKAYNSQQASPSPPVAAAEPADLTFEIPTAPIRMLDGISRLVLLPAEPLVALNVILPADPVDGQCAWISSTLPIAALALIVLPGQRLNCSPKPEPDPTAPIAIPTMELPANGSVGYLYSAPNATWDRIA